MSTSPTDAFDEGILVQDSPVEELHEALKAAGMRLTVVRRMVCMVLASADSEHLTEDDVYDRVTKVSPGVGRATISRTLVLLTDLGIIQHIHFGHNLGYYYLGGRSRHIHIVCENCSRIVTIEPEGLNEAIDAAVREYDFTIRKSNLALIGTCGDCG